jgi:hypothetical protein
MDLTQYGPFATVVAVAAALIATFSLTLLKMIGDAAKWTWMVQNTPPFLVTAGARAIAVGLIAATFLSIDKTNYGLFATAAVAFGLLMVVLLAAFDRDRRLHTYAVPDLNANGSVKKDAKGRPVEKMLVIGSEATLRPEAAKAFAAARKAKGVSLTGFLGGYGHPRVNDPETAWTREELAGIANRMTLMLVVIMLSAVMALYLAASAIEIARR